MNLSSLIYSFYDSSCEMITCNIVVLQLIPQLFAYWCVMMIMKIVIRKPMKFQTTHANKVTPVFKHSQ